MIPPFIRLRWAGSTLELWTPPSWSGCLPNLSWLRWMVTEMGWTVWPSTQRASPPCCRDPVMGRYVERCLPLMSAFLETEFFDSDPQVKVWNLSKHECVRTLQAHEGFVRGMVVRYCGTSFFTVAVCLFRIIWLYISWHLMWLIPVKKKITWHAYCNRSVMTKQSSSGRWSHRAMERKRSH